MVFWDGMYPIHVYECRIFYQDIYWDVSSVTLISYGLNSGHSDPLFTDSNPSYFTVNQEPEAELTSGFVEENMG